ncbi:unnamed protein product [Brassicogethes aeneus]|uniref:protein-tyrosine-phosphatase n=1 Tax=Brassicogethes aeneus TaxID=1431903 RepID=A0A9P0AZA2_BRAAE|nr:unnamed protein product [Brassicogethes aeneus]
MSNMNIKKILWFLLLYGNMVSAEKLNATFISTDEMCLTNSKFAMVNIFPIDSKQDYNSIYLKNNITLCGKYCFPDENWQVVDSLEKFPNFTELIKDKRWEDFPTILVEDGHLVGNKKRLLPINLNLSIPSEDFVLPLSVRSMESHIFICDGMHIENSECIWFIINGWGGTKSGIRYCGRNTIDLTINKYPTGDCGYLRFEDNRNTSIMNNGSWSHLLLTKKNDTWSLLFKEISLKLVNNHKSLKYIFLVNNRGHGIWKIHNLKHYSSKKTQPKKIKIPPSTTCISTFIKMCSKCKIVFYFEGKEKSPQIFQNTEWIEIKLKLAKRNQETYLYIKPVINTNQEKQFWHIDDIQDCSKQELRQVATKNGCCELFTNSEKSFLIDSSSEPTVNDLKKSRPLNYFGLNSSVETKYYDVNKYCEFNDQEQIECFCMPNYTGKNCAFSYKINILNLTQNFVNISVTRRKSDNITLVLKDTNGQEFNLTKHLNYFESKDLNPNTIYVAKLWYGTGTLNQFFGTPCLDIAENQILIKPSNTSAIFEFKNLTSYNCIHTMYNITINVSNSKVIPEVCMDLLKPNTEYKITLSRKNININKGFKTLEGVPEKPVNITCTWIRNKLTLSWRRPNETHGNLKKVKYKINNTEKECNITTNTLQHYMDFDMQNYSMEYGEEYDYEITIFNSMHSSETVIVKDASPPKLPYFWKNDFQKEKIEKGILLTIPYVIKNCKPCETYLQIDLLKPKNGSLMKTKKHLFIANKVKKIYIGENLSFNDNPEIIFTKYKFLSNEIYKVNLYLENVYKNRSNDQKYTILVEDFVIVENKNLYFLLILIPVCGLVAFLYLLKRTKVMGRTNNCRQIENLQDTDMANYLEHSNLLRKPVVKIKPFVLDSSHSNIVDIREYRDYVKKNLENGDLKNQFELLQRGQTQSWDYGSLEANKSKNRYANLKAYDHSRVKLQKINNDKYSDYINANYIDGYKSPNAYIATQGPKSSTLNDFWRMIWEVKAKNILMLANIYEDNKKKVEKYWPDINECKSFGDIDVRFISTEVFANYTIRYFEINMKNEQRDVKQIHFTAWPDHGVPLYPRSLIPILEIMANNKVTPMVVHCSAGVGRSGAVILCDISLKMAQFEHKVDILNSFEYLRSRRPNMVDNYEQYKLVHLVILEYIFGKITSLPCDNLLANNVSNIIQFEIDDQLEYLEDVKWQDRALRSIVEEEYENFAIYMNKNRFNEIIPENSGKIYLSYNAREGETSTYINAVYVDGFNDQNKFIATQQPMPNTVGDFWRMVLETESSLIISLNEVDLNDKTCGIFWPAQNTKLHPTDNITVFHEKSESYPLFDLIHAKLKVDEEMFSVKIVLHKNWKSNKVLPMTVTNFLSFLQETDTLVQKSNPIIVTCYNGATACGLYISLTFIIEKIKLEQECDVCQAVRYVRQNRREFINKVQFKFLYNAAVEYIKSFETYSNFA